MSNIKITLISWNVLAREFTKHNRRDHGFDADYGNESVSQTLTRYMVTIDELKMLINGRETEHYVLMLQEVDDSLRSMLLSAFPDQAIELSHHGDAAAMVMITNISEMFSSKAYIVSKTYRHYGAMVLSLGGLKISGVHMPFPDGDEKVEARNSLWDFITQFYDYDDDMIIMGDFNFEWDTVRAELRQRQMISEYHLQTQPTYRSGTSGLCSQIDHGIVLGNHNEITHVKIQGCGNPYEDRGYSSDHGWIMMEVILYSE